MKRNCTLLLTLALLCVIFCSSKPAGSKGHAYVDLGLSVKWATMNIGASSPTEDGAYICWGETAEKDSCSVWNYKWSDGFYWNRKYIKYGTEKFSMEKGDDPASAAWGGKWRLPTHAEQEELRKECDWTWTDNFEGSGVSGYIVTSRKYKDRSIFLPASGDKLGTTVRSHAARGFYFSSTMLEGYEIGACTLMFDSNMVDWIYSYRYYGHSMRPVIGK